MRIYKIVILLMLLSIFSCKSSYTKIGDKNANYIPYYLKVYEVDSLYNSKNYVNCKNELKNLFNNYEPINMSSYWEYEKYLKCLIINKSNKKYTREFEYLISNLGYKYDYIKKDSVLSIGLKKIKLTSLEINNLEIEYENSIDTDLIKMLKKMEYEDQEIRNKSGLSYEEKTPLIRKIDVKNDSILKDYIITNGFPNQKKIDGFSFDILFNHFSYNGSFDFYKENLPSFIRAGLCNPIVYSSMIDRWYLINKGEPFYYMRWIDKLKEIENDTLKIKKVNQERKKIGLPSIEQDKAFLIEQEKAYLNRQKNNY